MIGINYGILGDNFLIFFVVVVVIKFMKIGCVKIFNFNVGILVVLVNSGFEVVVVIFNDQIGGIGMNVVMVEVWIVQNVGVYYFVMNIVIIFVGNEVFLDGLFFWIQFVFVM